MSNPFVTPEPVVITPEEARATQLTYEYDRMVFESKQLFAKNRDLLIGFWDDTWESPVFSPEEKLARMGTNACAIFDVAAALAMMLYTVDPAVLDVKYLSAKLPYDRHEDGTITLSPA